ncbi:MAG: dihydroorotase [Sphingobacteriales bacterium]|nr:MAG: dihydroorotase [Sphingobacteriales bacterium]
MTTLFKNATIVNEGHRIEGDVLVKNGRIERIDSSIPEPKEACRVVDCTGLHLLPGCIDDQVHFREPGLTHKADIATESRAAVAGGVTSFMEMPNTVPPTLNREKLEEKFAIAARTSPANHSFFMGVSNDNADEVLRVNELKDRVCGVKIFMGSSTGSMLVDNYLTLEKIFSGTELLIATHCEDERIIAANKAQFPDADNASYHPLIRNEAACFESSFAAVQLAKKHDTRLHILHITTTEELRLFGNMLPLAEKRITAEVCVHHLHFTADDYAQLGNQIKCNPAIKSARHKPALWEALLDDRLDIIATDHAPHTLAEKQQPYQQAPAGLPLVQHSLLLMLQYVREGRISLEKVVEKMAHAPAICFNIRERGFIREGYHADLVLVDLNDTTTVHRENLLYKCGWSPLEGRTLPARVAHTFVNGNEVWNGSQILEGTTGERLYFDR